MDQWYSFSQNEMAMKHIAFFFKGILLTNIKVLNVNNWTN